MASKKTDGDRFAVDFGRDVKTMPADLEALARARQLRPLTAEEYQQWVDLVAKHHPFAMKDRETNHDTDEPFTLP